MIRNTADCQADVARFVRRVAESEVVWYLTSDSGTAWCESNAEDDQDEPGTVLLFFSDEPYAKRVQRHFPEHIVKKMPLFDFLFRWLPGMSGDGALVGPNWNGDLVGLELDPYKLRVEIIDVLSAEQRSAHKARYDELTKT